MYHPYWINHGEALRLAQLNSLRLFPKRDACGLGAVSCEPLTQASEMRRPDYHKLLTMFTIISQIRKFSPSGLKASQALKQHAQLDSKER